MTAQQGPEYFFRYNKVSGGTGYKTLGPTVVGSTNEECYYPLFANYSFLKSNGFPTNTLSRVTLPSITVKIYSGYDPGAVTSGSTQSANALVQTITMSPPSGSISLPVPTVSQNATYESEPIPGLNGGATNTYEILAANTYTDYNARIGEATNMFYRSSYATTNAWYNQVGTSYAQQGIDQGNANGHQPSPFIIGANGTTATGDVVRNGRGTLSRTGHGRLKNCRRAHECTRRLF